MNAFPGLLLLAAAAPAVRPTPDIMAAIQESHIAANVPAPDAFDRILQRDLTAYVRRHLNREDVSVRYEMLRHGPTQSGVSYPKFYVWVQVIGSDQQPVRQGAARVAAIEAKEFEITDFLSEEAIRTDPAIIRNVFPGPVCEAIEQKVRGRR